MYTLLSQQITQLIRHLDGKVDMYEQSAMLPGVAGAPGVC